MFKGHKVKGHKEERIQVNVVRVERLEVKGLKVIKDSASYKGQRLEVKCVWEELYLYIHTY